MISALAVSGPIVASADATAALTLVGRSAIASFVEPENTSFSIPCSSSEYRGVFFRELGPLCVCIPAFISRPFDSAIREIVFSTSKPPTAPDVI